MTLERGTRTARLVRTRWGSATRVCFADHCCVREIPLLLQEAFAGYLERRCAHSSCVLYIFFFSCLKAGVLSSMRAVIRRKHCRCKQLQWSKGYAISPAACQWIEIGCVINYQPLLTLDAVLLAHPDDSYTRNSCPTPQSPSNVALQKSTSALLNCPTLHVHTAPEA